MRPPFRLIAPASTANLGPGFDCLGLALQLYHRLSVWEEEGEGLEIRVEGEGEGQVPLDERNPVYQAMQRVFAPAGHRPGRLRLDSRNEIPLAAGLGSSAAACAVGLAAGMLLCGQELDRDRLIALGVEEEGHPDNVAPCVLGGFAVAVRQERRIACLRLDPPAQMQALVAVPDFALPTQKARKVLPARVKFGDAVFNQGRTALLAAALSSGQLELLRIAMQDRLHQPYRAALVPGLEEVLRAALEAGALGASLSGAGPAVLALVRQGETRPGPAMQEAWKQRGIASRLLVLDFDRAGLRVEPPT